MRASTPAVTSHAWKLLLQKPSARSDRRLRYEVKEVFDSRKDYHMSIKISFSGLLWLACLIGGTGPGYCQPAPLTSLDAAALIEQIKTEIQEARKLKTRPTLTIKNVKITLNTKAERSADGSVKFVIPIIPINGSTEVAVTTTQVLSLSFKPEGAIDIGAKSSLGLADAINAAKIAIQTAMSSDPRFKLDDLVYEADFVLKADAKGGFSFWVFDVGVEIAKSSTQHVAVELSPAETQ